ncbi:MAG TPA: hypothetical protein VGN82_07395 [Bosea sp. (in: a-proteobacteria)]|uniref:hypothetical protein n=1 Tax=Bosea sp. (in: a-proteobacteria) TaxID=1871050 RepID=UPI002E0EBB66|nr:hypothetical protein [Bosea sp. (in: a-proteobacteria)]
MGRLRRSALGAWLAVAYALTMLASGLAPAPAAAHGFLDGAILCSGLPLPAQEASTPVPEPAGEPTHCKGCPLNPVLASPVPLAPAGIAREPVALLAKRPPVERTAPSPSLRLPPARAPPIAWAA